MKGWPKHPFRITLALILTGIGASCGMPLNIVFIAGALRLLWNL